MTVRLTTKQYRELAFALAVAGASLLVALKYFSHAFPEAAIQFRVNRSQSRGIAEQFLDRRGFNLKGYRHAAIFDFDDTAMLYLERTQGLAAMDRLTRGPVHLWRWSHRWFKPQQKEQFSADVTPEGQVVGFQHEIPEAAPGANLSQSQALGIAERFLAQAMHRNLEDLEFVGAERRNRPARTDYQFTWKRKDVHLGAGSLRVQVSVDGNQVAGYSEYVKVPRAWIRSYQQIRSRNDAAQEVDQVLWALLWIAMLVILVNRLRDRDVPLKLSIGFGAVAASLYFLKQLNSFPVAKFSFTTTSSYSSFLTSYFFGAAATALGTGTLIFLVVACAEPVYREGFPSQLSFRRYFSWPGVRSRSFFVACVVGVCLAVFFFAYQTVFYLIANRLGAWAPADIPFSNMLNTQIPWAAVLFMGFFPAVNEELQFRAFAIPFLKKLTRSWPLALVLAAFNWGFLHSAYPNQPFFIRGVEVGLGGIVVGLIMLRFGILCTLIWHYSVDALYTAFLLLRSPNHYFEITGGVSAGIMLIPLAISLAAYLATGTFTDEAELTNAREGISRPPRAEIARAPELLPQYRPLTKRRIVIAGVVIVASLAVLGTKFYRLGEGLRLRTTRASALRTAEAFLAQRRVKASVYYSAAWLYKNVDPFAVRYLSERLPLRRVGRVLRQSDEPWLWESRFFRPLHQEEWLVFVNAVNGKVFGYRHLLNHQAPGATLSPSQAIALGEKAVTAHGYDLADFDLQASQAIKRKAREDYFLVWQAKAGDPRNVGRAKYRLEVDIAGNEVVGFSRGFKLPDSWIRQQSATHLLNSVLLALEFILGGGIVAGAVWLFILRIRRGEIRWMRPLKVAVVLTIFMGLLALNELPLIGREYNTSISLENFHIQVAMSFIVLALAAGALLWCVIALAASLYPEVWSIFRLASRRLWRRDAAIAVAVSLAAGLGISHLLGLLGNHFHAVLPPGFPAPTPLADSLSPVMGGIVQGLLYSVAGTSALAVAIFGISRGWRRQTWWFWAGAVLLLISLGPSGAHSFAEYGAGWLVRFIPLAATVAIFIAFFRNNPLAYVAAVFCAFTVKAAASLLVQPAAALRGNGVALAVLILAVLAWLFAIFDFRLLNLD